MFRQVQMQYLIGFYPPPETQQGQDFDILKDLSSSFVIVNISLVCMRFLTSVLLIPHFRNFVTLFL